MKTVILDVIAIIKGNLAADFRSADNLCYQIEKELRTGSKVVVNMEGVSFISQTFAHVAFSQLYRSFPARKVKKALSFSNIPPKEKANLLLWIKKYSKHYRRFFKNELSEEELVLYPGVTHAFTPTFDYRESN